MTLQSRLIETYKELFMKSVESKQPVHTIPDGIWESSRPGKEQKSNHSPIDNNSENTPHTTKDLNTTNKAADLMGNGYTTKKSAEH